MPEITVAGQCIHAAEHANLLDTLLAAGLAIPYSCRAGSCHACLVRCTAGEPLDALPEALTPSQREAGWRLACQCRVAGDLALAVFDPQRDGLPALVSRVDWPAPDILRLRLLPERPLRYSVGQHLLLWGASGVARPYSLASLPGTDAWLEFHIDCSSAGAFCDQARQLRAGDRLTLGELHSGALHYDPEWQTRPLLLLAAGTGLAPLWGILREALRQGHQGPVRLLHVARDGSRHYLATELATLAAAHPPLQVELLQEAEATAALAKLQLVSRQTIALVCGPPAAVEHFARRLYLAGLPRSQLYADVFLPRANQAPA
ncbi:iron-sulfur-binding ferredoxin reductase [Pseudomonas sp. N040]|uniref:iron-sulfur-binding ferredoxin reductase n=1 Tax=Pseudomonas sp. N040 TaxID=2785325 RepID=UPI0018A25B14|nr:iron-sulfur-binding ferredoxin reductase [Pseudomonas sp. N040]MBF7730527.1 iron-sulfur-binding ferredoxin reductase [Pseudomonas sp. N040]MBW7014171.1 iron-sulfur-binding ferredoxin reductase [Pseudomonas sp. N040]